MGLVLAVALATTGAGAQDRRPMLVAPIDPSPLASRPIWATDPLRDFVSVRLDVGAVNRAHLAAVPAVQPDALDAWYGSWGTARLRWSIATDEPRELLP